MSGSLKWQNKTYQFATKEDSDKRRILTNTQTGMTMPLQAIPTSAHSLALSPSLLPTLSPPQMASCECRGGHGCSTVIPSHTDGKAC